MAATLESVQDLSNAASCLACLNETQLSAVSAYLLQQIYENPGVSTHDLLSLIHPDTVPGPPMKGSIVVGNSTPKWEAFPVGLDGLVLGADSTEPFGVKWVSNSAFPGFAAPSTLVSLSSSVGMAATALRSDAGLALDQGIAPTWTAAHIWNPPDNTTPISITGFNLTGANTQPFIDISGEWNTAGTPSAIKLNITNTSSPAASLLIDLQVDSISRAKVDRQGVFTLLRQEADTSLSGFIFNKRGTTGDATAALSAGSGIASYAFGGWDGTGFFQAVSMRAFTNEAWTAVAHGSRLLFLVVPTGSITLGTVAVLGQGLNLGSATNPTDPGIGFLRCSGVVTTGQSALSVGPFGAAAGNTGEVRFLELAATGTSYVGFKAPDSITANQIWALPSADGGIGTFLQTTGAGVLQFTAALTDGQLLIGDTGAAPVAASLTAGANISITPGAGSITIAATGVVTQAYSTIQEEGVGLTQRSTLNFIGAAITAADDAGNSRTNITLSQSPASASVVGIGRQITIAGTANQVISSAGAQDLSADRTWTLSLPQDIHTAATPQFARLGLGAAADGAALLATTGQAAIQLNPFGAAAGNTGEIRFLELAATGTHYTGFKAPDSIAASEIYVLPDAAPSANRYLRAAAVSGGVSVLSWQQVQASEIGSGAALTTGVADPNVTITLGGTPATALLTAASITIGWSGTLAVDRGGTNIASYAIGDLLYASGATTLSKLADVAAGSYLRSGGVTTAPLWSTLRLPNASAQGDIFYSTAANAMTTLAKNTTATRYLSNTGPSNDPAWEQVNLANGVTGTLPVGNGGTGATSFIQGSVIFAGAGGVLSQDNPNFFWDDTNNRLGIGLNAISAAISIKQTGTGIINLGQLSGNSSFSGIHFGTSSSAISAFTWSIGGDATNTYLNASTGGTIFHRINNANIMFMTATGLGLNVSPSFLLDLSKTFGNAATNQYAVRFNVNATPTANEATSATYAQTVICQKNGAFNLTTATDSGGLRAFSMQCGNSGSGSLNGLAALEAFCYNNGSGTVTRAHAFYAYQPFADTVNGPITNAYAFFAAAQARSGVTNAYALYLEGASDISYINGKLGIGTNAPGARLHLPAGTTTAGTAPLRFTIPASDALATPVAGTMETDKDDSDNLFWTITTGAARKEFCLADPVGGLTSGRVPFATTNGRLTDNAGLGWDTGLLTLHIKPNVDVDAAGNTTLFQFMVDAVPIFSGTPLRLYWNGTLDRLELDDGSGSGVPFYFAGNLTTGQDFSANNITAVTSLVVGTAFGLTGADGLIYEYGNIGTEGWGLASIVDDVQLTNQSAAIGSTNFTNAGTAGTYRVAYYLVVTTADATAGSIRVDITANDGTAARTLTGVTVALTATNRATRFTNSESDGTLIRLGSGSIAYSVVLVAGAINAARFSLFCTVERLS